MRRTVSGGLLLAVAAPVLALPAVAFAETQQVLAVDASAWTWRSDSPAGNPVAQLSNVPDGDLAVQFDGRPDAPPAKATYLRLALGDVPAGSTPLALTLTLPLDGDVNQDGQGAALVACPLATPFTVGAGVDPATMPAEDCTAAAVGRYDPVAKSFSFSLTGLAASWLAGSPNNGVVVRPDPAVDVPDALPYQLSFLGAKAITGRLTTQVGAAVVAPEQPREPQQSLEQPWEPALAPVPGFASGPSVSGPALAPMPRPARAPSVAATAPQATAAVPMALPGARSRAGVGASQEGLMAGVVLGLLLLSLVGWSVSEGAHPLPFARRERRRRDRLAVGVLVLPAQPRQMRQARRPASSATSTVTYS